MPSYSLDDIHKEANNKFEAVEFDLPGGKVVMLPAVRLDPGQRAAAKAANEKIQAVQGDDDAPAEDFEDAILDVMCAVSEDPGLAREALGGLSLADKIALMTLYKGDAQLGEASGSSSS